ncbi:hypothetical protein [Sphingomonas melonis]|uniref:hypothetical protein n=1 Tax=Sphingomonas melonis TaxID=152682 RepID=UPI000BE3EB81|nr:hypothetical protein [Sphingomonas melonis]ATI54500.1 hypothetical protein CP552_01895 [Sphingomonas melonis]
MKIKTNTPLTELDGAPIMMEGAPLTVRGVLVRSLLLPPADGRSLPGDEQVRRYDLAQRVYREEEVTISTEDAVVMKNCVAASWGPLVTGQMFTILNGDG